MLVLGNPECECCGAWRVGDGFGTLSACATIGKPVEQHTAMTISSVKSGRKLPVVDRSIGRRPHFIENSSLGCSVTSFGSHRWAGSHERLTIDSSNTHQD